MPDGTLPLLLAIIALVILSATFSATETAYTSLNVIKIKSLALKEKKYKKVLDLYERYDRLLTTILIGNNVVNLTASSLSALFFAKILKNGANATLVSTIFITVVVLLIGEITPKFLAKSFPEKFAVTNYPFIITCFYLFYPLSLFLGGFRKIISLIVRVKPDDTITDEELLTIVNEAQEDGTLKEEESVLIKSAIEFDDLEVRDVLVPRINVVAVSVEETNENIRKVFENEGYSRLPVYKENIDGIIGIIHEKDFYKNCEKPGFSIKSIMQEVIFVVEHTKISALLKRLQAKKIHMAVVLDEYGGTLGIITLEDILEELVGEIYDEYDDEEAATIKENEDGTYTVSGSADLDDFFERFGLYDDDEQFDANSVGGWVTEKLGEMPVAGKKFGYKNLNVTVTKVTRKRVLEIKIEVTESEKEEESND